MTYVLHIITGLNVGGAEMALFRLISSSDFSGRHVVVSLTGDGTMSERFRHAGIDLILLNFKKSFFTDFLRLVFLIRNLRPMLVQTWMYHADLIGGIAARLAGQKNIIWGIRHTGFSKGSSRITVLVMRLCALLSRWVPRYIICVAEASREAHIRYGYDKTKMAVIPNGLDIPFPENNEEKRKKVRLQFGIAATDILIGIVGRFHPDKDHATFIQAAELLLAKHHNVRFLMVGRGLDQCNHELMQMFSNSAVASHFILLGERDDVPNCLNIMDVFCLSSRFEGFPNVVAEAMAMGLPCVVTKAGDAAYVVGEHGSVVEVGKPIELSNAIEYFIIKGEAYRRVVGTAARQRVCEHFSVKRMREQYQEIYNKLTQNLLAKN